VGVTSQSGGVALSVLDRGDRRVVDRGLSVEAVVLQEVLEFEFCARWSMPVAS